jgi:hypothetical protein
MDKINKLELMIDAADESNSLLAKTLTPRSFFEAAAKVSHNVCGLVTVLSYRVMAYTHNPSHSCNAVCHRSGLWASEYSVRGVDSPVRKSTG